MLFQRNFGKDSARSFRTRSQSSFSTNDISEEANHGQRMKKHELSSDYDKANYVIPHQVHLVICGGDKNIKVVSADTDVFIILRKKLLKICG